MGSYIKKLVHSSEEMIKFKELGVSDETDDEVIKTGSDQHNRIQKMIIASIISESWFKPLQ